MNDHWMTTGLLGANASFQRAAREYAEEYAAAAVAAERERICAAIKAEDDHCAGGDYMLDSDDCIKVARGQWQRADWG